MRLRESLTLAWIMLLVPVTAFGSYFAYTGARDRVEEVNQVIPISETDMEEVIRLVLRLDEAEEQEPEEAAPLGALEISSVQLDDSALTADETNPAPTPDTSTPDETTESEATSDVAASAPVATPSFNPLRVNVLLMGIDQREGEEGQFRTDTMMVLSVDPIAKTGAVLSLPRDLWVTIPGGFGESRINTANYIGDNPELDYPGGGPALAMETVEKVTGIAIDHYVLVNFDAFVTMIKVVGAIEVCPPEPIDDPKYPDGSYGFNPIYIEAGCQEMEGERILQYVRTRATSGGDFDRAARQQEALQAIRDQILSLGGATALLGDAFELWESISNNIRTDLTLDELIELGFMAQEVVELRTGTISESEVLTGVAPDGSDILIPIQTDILALVADLFRPPNTPAVRPTEEPTPIALDPENVPLAVREEAAIVVILNGTEISGRANALRDIVLGYNVDVGFVGNRAPADAVQTSIIYYGNHAESADYLAQIVATVNNGTVPSIQQREAGVYGQWDVFGGTPQDGDVFVIVGTDLSLPES